MDTKKNQIEIFYDSSHGRGVFDPNLPKGNRQNYYENEQKPYFENIKKTYSENDKRPYFENEKKTYSENERKPYYQKSQQTNSRYANKTYRNKENHTPSNQNKFHYSPGEDKFSSPQPPTRPNYQKPNSNQNIPREYFGQNPSSGQNQSSGQKFNPNSKNKIELGKKQQPSLVKSVSTTDISKYKYENPSPAISNSTSQVFLNPSKKDDFIQSSLRNGATGMEPKEITWTPPN